jgi:hypothetical protein
MSNTIAKDALREASAIWKLARRHARLARIVGAARRGGRSTVNVTFDDAPGSVAGPDVPLAG